EHYERFARLLRNGLDPWMPAHRRQTALRTLASYSPDHLEMLFRDVAFKDVLGALDAPYSVPEPSEGATSPRTGRRNAAYGLGADLRRLLNAAFTSRWYRIDGNIEKAVRASDRALICAAAVEGDSPSDDDLARGVAWTQMVPGA